MSMVMGLLAGAVLASRPPPVTAPDCIVSQPAFVCPGEPIAMLWCPQAKFFIVEADGRRRPARDADLPAGYHIVSQNDPPPTCPAARPPISPRGHSPRKH
jgi:hypothetical protein